MGRGEGSRGPAGEGAPSHRGCFPQDPKGELQGQNVLTVRYSLELTAARFGLDVDAVRTLLNTGLEKLFQARKHRPKPHLDSKMLAAWNGEVAGPDTLFPLTDLLFEKPLVNVRNLLDTSSPFNRFIIPNLQMSQLRLEQLK